MNRLTLQIDKPCFQAILKGEQKTEHRFIYPSNEATYVRYECDGVTYKHWEDIPDGDSEIHAVPVEYDALYLINGRRKDAPRLLVEVESTEYVVLADEEGNDLTAERNGVEYLVAQVWYHLGKVLETENL